MCKRTFRCLRREEYCANTSVCESGIFKKDGDALTHPDTNVNEVCNGTSQYIYYFLRSCNLARSFDISRTYSHVSIITIL